MRVGLSRLKLSARLAIAIVLAVVASFLLDQALRTMIPPPPFLMVQRAWLVESIARATDQGGGAAVASRHLDFSILPEPPFAHGGTAGLFADGFRASLLAATGQAPADVRVHANMFSDNAWERSSSTAVAIIPDLPTLLTAEELASNRSSVLGTLEIAVRRPDGRWLIATARRTVDARWHYARTSLVVAGNLLILVVFSVWMARSIVAPLGRLASAAERMGREREPTLIGDMRLPEFAAIAETFNAMQLRLKRFVDERVQMLAAISHDLRTPLTRLRLLAEYVDDDEQRAQLRANLAEMETMVADALAFMREEALHEAAESVDLAALLISLADTSNDLGEDVAYEGPDHLDILCRPVAMKRAFANLVANGCKYGGAVRIGLAAPPDGTIVVEVSDGGPGIAQEDEERAFTPFARLETSRSRETGGTGLGLAISRDVIRSHGGTIGFRRGEDGFTVRVPLPGLIPPRAEEEPKWGS